MIHIYLSLAPGDLVDHHLVTRILDLDARLGLVQAAGADDEMTRQIAVAHMAACDALVVVVSGKPDPRQMWEIRSADEIDIPVWLLSDDATVDVVEGRPVRTFDAEQFLDFVGRLEPPTQK